MKVIASVELMTCLLLVKQMSRQQMGVFEGDGEASLNLTIKDVVTANPSSNRGFEVASPVS